MLKLSKRTSGLEQSAIRSMTRECSRINGINMAQGVCDLDIPPEITNGAKRAIDNGFNIYLPCEGHPDLRKAIGRKMKDFYNMDVAHEQEVFISAGATGAFYSTCLALLNPGDEVLLLEPFYGYHSATLKAIGCTPVFASMEPPRWQLNPDQLENAVSSRTKALVINTPANPSGKVFNQSELEFLAEFTEKHNLWIFSDEIYEHFVYGNNRHIPPATIPGLHKRTITISGFSKIFSITGWRLGYAVCPPDVCEAASHMNDIVYVCGPSPLQIGATMGLLNLGQTYYETVANDHLMKRDLFCTALENAGLKPAIPDGAYYTLADISKVPGNSEFDKVMYILDKTGIASVPGNAFYNSGPEKNLARFCFAKKTDILTTACDRLKRLNL